MLLTMTAVWATKVPDVQVSVLCYHNVDLQIKTPYSVTSQQLSAHIDALRNAGFQFITLKQLDDFIYKGMDIPSKSVAVTFDDGNHNTLTNALPLLQKLRVPFAVFIYPSAIGVGHQRGFMDWTDIKTLQKNGVIIGCHAFDHPYLTRPPNIKTADAYDHWLDMEIMQARSVIESHTGGRVHYFALPFGLSDVMVYQKIKQSGYRLSFNVCGMTNSSQSDPLYYNRIIVINTDTPAKVVAEASIRPIYFKRTIPVNLTYTAQANFVAGYQLVHPENYDLSTVRLLMGKPSRGYENPSATMNFQEVHLPQEAFYNATVLAKDKQGRTCMGNWSFIYQKIFPAWINKAKVL